MNRDRLAVTGHDDKLEARINSFELAFRMQSAAPELQDISDESESTQNAYGLHDGPTKNFGRQCLMARRFIEKGVRFVQCTHSYKWDQHGDLRNGHTRNAKEVDQPIAALIQDLKGRGLLDSTMVVWGAEFGRTPLGENRGGRKQNTGRDHHPYSFTTLLSGGGLKGGMTYGSKDEVGWGVADKPVHINDLHATMLHQFGLDHLQLTHRFQGRDFRLTDVGGKVVHDWIA